MKLNQVKTGKGTNLYITRSVYVADTKRYTSQTVEKLGRAEDIMEERNMTFDEVIAWAKSYISELNRKEKEEREAASTSIAFSTVEAVAKDKKRNVNVGYLYPKKVCSELGIRHICEQIKEKENFTYDLGEILEYLVIGRIMDPSSKVETYRWAQKLLEAPDFSAHQVYRALSVLARHSDFIQNKLYSASKRLIPRQTGVLYYDCTNYFFEVSQADEGGLRQYGISKEHRPNPIVQMGLFMDRGGIPLAFNITPGNQNEQLTMTPLEKRIIADFGAPKFVVCTDAGLSSAANKKFNSMGDRAYVSATSVKKLKRYLLDWALSPDGWRIAGSDGVYDLREVDEVANYHKTFYKERWIKDASGFEERLIVTFSFKYKEYEADVRESQIERALSKIEKNGPTQTHSQNDPARFIGHAHYTDEGEVADNVYAYLDTDKIAREARFDGFCAISTSLEDPATEIIAINHSRWQVEECFRILKHEFKSRPVYVSRQDRICAHFLTCFIALLVYKIMDAYLDHKLSCARLIDSLNAMNLTHLGVRGWTPDYYVDEADEAIFDAFGFRADTDLYTNRTIRTLKAKAADHKRIKGFTRSMA